MTGKSGERRGPWHHAAVAALQGASIEEQLQYLDPDVVPGEELSQMEDAPGLGFGARVLGTGPGVGAARASGDAGIDDSAARAEVIQRWGRWDVHARGRLVRR